MTDRQRQMIEAYLPHERDESLDWDEYYVKDTAERIQKVHIFEICPCGEETHYGVRTDSGKTIRCFTSDGRFAKRHMYDNKIDCKNETHFMFDNWEKLRELQINERKD